MSAFVPRIDCPKAFSANREQPDADRWTDAAQRLCLGEMPDEIEARIRLVVDLFVRVTNAYEAFASSADSYASFRASAWTKRIKPTFADEYRRLYEAASTSTTAYEAALKDLAAALQTNWWVLAAASEALNGLDRGAFELTVGGGAGVATHASYFATPDGAARPRGWFPGVDAAAPLNAPLAMPPLPLAIASATPSPMPVFFFGRVQITRDGFFVTRTAHELAAADGNTLYGLVQDSVCSIRPDLCNKAADPESAANIVVQATTSGEEQALFIAAPAEYAICRAAIDWIDVAMPPNGLFAAAIARADGRNNGLAVRARLPQPVRSSTWIKADVLLSFVRQDLLASSNCWPDGTSAWNCTSRFCADIHPQARVVMPRPKESPVACRRDQSGHCVVPLN